MSPIDEREATSLCDQTRLGPSTIAMLTADILFASLMATTRLFVCLLSVCVCVCVCEM